MGKKQVTTPTRISTKKKKWYNIVASKEFNNLLIGETLAELPEKLKGRSISMDLGVLMNSPKRQGFSLKFMISGLDDKGNAVADIKKYEMTAIQSRRIARKGKGGIDDSFVIEHKDGKAKIKPLLIGKEKVVRSKRTVLKEKIRNIIKEFCKDKTFSEIMMDIINNELQKKLRADTRKIYPLIVYEIRVFEKVQ